MSHLCWLLLGGALAALAAASCEPALTLEEALEGKSCAPGNQCLPGFICDQNENLCVRATGGQGGAAGGQSGRGGAASGASASGGGPSSAGRGNVGGSNVGGSNVGGAVNAGSGGNGGAVSGGAGGVGGSGAQGGDGGDAGAGGCIPAPLYADLDGDGHGSGALQSLGCPSVGLSAENDDCLDAVPTGSNYAELVYPGQDEYFGFAYPFVGAPNGLSFDFDCSDEEEPDPNNNPINEAPDCESLDANDCAGQGWRPEPERPSGNGVLAICGVEIFITCVVRTDFCVSEFTQGPDGLPYLCK